MVYDRLVIGLIQPSTIRRDFYLFALRLRTTVRSTGGVLGPSHLEHLYFGQDGCYTSLWLFDKNAIDAVLRNRHLPQSGATSLG